MYLLISIDLKKPTAQHIFCMQNVHRAFLCGMHGWSVFHFLGMVPRDVFVWWFGVV